MPGGLRGDGGLLEPGSGCHHTPCPVHGWASGRGAACKTGQCPLWLAEHYASCHGIQERLLAHGWRERGAILTIAN